MADVPAVYAAIRDVMADIGQTGIAKGRKNQQQGYNFRGIDDVYNELNSLLSKHSLVIVPRILTRDVVERQTQKGGALFYVTVEAEFDLISAIDGSKHTVRTLGEAMDSGDKATNKAMSAAYKYAAMMLFCIPTEGDNDADFQTHEVAHELGRQKWQAEAQTAAMHATRDDSHLKANGKPEKGWRADGTRTSYWLKTNRSWDALKAMLDEDLVDCHSLVTLETLKNEYRKMAQEQRWNRQYLDSLTHEFNNHEKALMDQMDAKELAEVPLRDALTKSLAQHPINAG